MPLRSRRPVTLALSEPREIVARTGVQELMLTATTHDIATKAATYEAVSQRW